MNSEEKKAHLLLKTVIFHYHGLDEDEKQILELTANEIDAREELTWTTDFISQDFTTAFERAFTFLTNTIGKMPKEKRLNYLDMAWKANNQKGYITELEATAMLKFAKEWQIENELISMVRGA